MEENKKQNFDPAADGIVVKDTEGNFKVLSDGELKDMDALLAATAETIAPHAVTPPRSGTALDVPRFTDLALVPEDPHFIQPAKTTKSGETVEHHFHPEDKEEIERELDKLNSAFSLQPQKQYSIVKITQKVLEKHSVKFTDAEVTACTKLFASYFRQMRSVVETRTQLMLPKAQGGFGLASDTADHILVVLKHLKDTIEEMDGTIVEVPIEETPAPKTAPVLKQQVPEPRPVVPEPLKPEPRPTPVPTQAPVKPVLEKIVSTPPVPPKSVAPEPEPLPKAVPVATPQPVAPPVMPPQAQKPIEDALPKVTRPQTTSTFKVPIIEVKKPQINAIRSGAPIGRVEELALMDMATWRMLDEDPRIRAGKVLGKIQNLEQESLTRKSQGIQAWRSNEVYQHYLAIGQMSLEQKKDVAEVIAAIKAQGQETLTLDEFEAISDLNRTLRF